MQYSYWILILNLLISLFVGLANAQDAFNEVFLPNGEVRPEYKVVYTLWSQLSAEQREKLFLESKVAFGGDNFLSVMPRVLSGDEINKTLKPGVDQRARAIQAFLKDHYSGSKKYLKDQIVPKATVDRALEKAMEKGYDGKLDPKVISYFYGPDMIRDEKGSWRVIEDNPGFVGGLGDLILAYEYTVKHSPKILEYLKIEHPREFYRSIGKIFDELAKRHGGRVVMFQAPPYADREDGRLRKIYADMGVATVTPNSQMQMRVQADGVYIYDSKYGFEASAEKVGFIIMNGEHWWLDPDYSEARKQAILEEARSHLEEKQLKKSVRLELEKALANYGQLDYEKILEIIKSSNLRDSFSEDYSNTKMSRGLVQAMLDGKVNSSYSPGVNFIGDKELYIYVPKMIEYYLHEKPILQNLETDSFADAGGQLRRDLVERVFSDFKSYVVKGTAGRGGDSVWVGPFTEAKGVEEIKERVIKAPQDYIVQKFTPLSRFMDLIVDIRMYAFVHSDGVFVGENGWSRGLPKGGNGKVNLSDQGRELPVFISHGQKKFMCSQFFAPSWRD